MLQGLTGWHFLIILAVILLLFGAAKLPALAKSMGQSARVFRGEMKAMKEEDASAKTEAPTAESSTASSRLPRPTCAQTRAEPQTPSPDAVATAGPPRIEEPDVPRRDKRMSLGQHLVELRKRLMIAALALVLGMIVGFLITDPVL